MPMEDTHHYPPSMNVETVYICRACNTTYEHLLDSWACCTNSDVKNRTLRFTVRR